MKSYLLKTLILVFILQDFALAKDMVDGLIENDKVTETEYITHYNEDQAIDAATGLIKKHKGSRLEPELRHRLADLYVRQSKTRNFLDQILKKKGKNFSSEFESVPAKQRILRNAIVELQTVEKSFPRYGKMDEVFYTMGMTYLKLGDVDLAERPFLILVNKFKNSPLVQDSNLSLAEVYYHQKNYKNSEIYFSKLTIDNNHNAQAYSIYKRGWTRYYQAKYQSAFQDMKSSYLLSLSKKNGFNVASEVLKDLPLFTSEVFSGDQVLAQLSQFIKDQKIMDSTLDDHAKVYAGRSDYKDETAVLNVMFKRAKNVNTKFEILSRLFISYENSDNLVMAAQYYEKAHKIINQKIDEDIKEEFLVYGRNLVKNAYKEWTQADEKAKKRMDLKSILKIGDMAHTTISNDDAQKPKFINLLAELHFGINSFDKASVYFEMASDVSKVVNESHELLYSAIVSNENAVASDKWTKDTVLRQRHLVQKYDQKYPEGKYGLEVLYKFARVEEKFGKQPLALATFRRLGSQYPNTIKGKDSQDFVIKIYEKNKDYNSVNVYLGEIIPKTTDVSRLNVLKPIFDNSFFLMAEMNEKKGSYKLAIVNYKNYLSKSFLKLKLTEAAWNIAIDFKKAGFKRSAADAYLAFYKNNPKHTNSKLALTESLALYEKIYSYPQIEVVATILENTTSAPESYKWSYSVARVQIKNKKLKESEAKFYKLVQIPDQKLNTEIHQFLFDHVEKFKVGFKDNALRVLQTGNEPFKSEAYIRVAVELLDQKKEKEARSKFLSVLNSKDGLAESKAKASIFLAEMDVKSLELDRAKAAFGFNGAVKFIETTMGKAGPITEKFQNVLKFGHDESSLRALIKLSRLYLDLGMVMGSVVINDKPDLKLAIDRELRNLKSTLRTSFYESYESSLNIMAKNSKLKSKYNSRVRKIKQEFEVFYNQNSVASRDDL